jgi:nucleoside-diphosphate-sugar epimerase
MRIVITGGGGFLGRKLAHRLLAEADQRGIEEIVLLDVVMPPAGEFNDPRLKPTSGNITNPSQVENLIGSNIDGIFHLAAVVSAGAEADFDLGYKVNFEGTRNILEAARASGAKPKVMFASSIATYGGDLPDMVTDETPVTPQTSYGVQKVIGEQLINDYSRKGYLDGRAMRLPTIVVRPGKPNKAASGFASGIIREPLNNTDMVCPVTPESRMAMMSPRRVIDAFVRLFDLPSDAFGHNRTLPLPGLSVSMAEACDALEQAAGNRHRGTISFDPDPEIQAIVDGWPKASFSERAANLGFKGDDNMVDIINAYIEDELGD